MAPSVIPSISGSLNFSALRSSFSYHQSVAVFKWELSGDRDAKLVTHRSKAQTFRVLENPNASPGKDGSIKEVIMVDPLEAKRLAAKQMDRIKAKEKFKRSCQIEAINGAWAMIGLTAGIVIEGHTGNGILSQLAGYWEAIVHFFMR